MEAHLNSLLHAQRNQDAVMSDPEDEHLSLDLSNELHDLMVSDEGEWIARRRHELMRIWKGLKGLCRVHLQNDTCILEQATFGIFASFMYRWTGEDTDSSSSDLGEETTANTEEATTEMPHAPDHHEGHGE